MATTLPTSRSRPQGSKQSKSVARIIYLLRKIFRRLHPAWYLCLLLLVLLIATNLPSSRSRIVHAAHLLEGLEEPTEISEHDDAAASLLQNDQLVRDRMAVARNNSKDGAFVLGNHFCIMQPTLSAGKEKWTEEDARKHIALRAFMRTFASTVTKAEREQFRFSIYYGHDSDDKVFGNPTLREAFADEAEKILSRAGFGNDDVKLVFTPLYGLHGRINAIWNVLAKDAYYDGCDYFFASNDDMVFFTEGWVRRSSDSLNGIGSPHAHKRPCRNLGIVRFKDEWASWATFTFHVSTKLHMEIFGGVYYPVPYNAAHNDYWIHFVYGGFEASKYRGEIRVRNRVDDVDYVLAHQKEHTHIAKARYDYGERGDAKRYIKEGRARLMAWLRENQGTERCQKPLSQ